MKLGKLIKAYHYHHELTSEQVAAQDEKSLATQARRSEQEHGFINSNAYYFGRGASDNRREARAIPAGQSRNAE